MKKDTQSEIKLRGSADPTWGSSLSSKNVIPEGGEECQRGGERRKELLEHRLDPKIERQGKRRRK